MKTTLLVDCSTGTIIDIHCTTNRPHDTKIGWQVLRRNIDRIRTITADKGYDWADLRDELRDNDVRPVIKHREFDDSTGRTTPDSTTTPITADRSLNRSSPRSNSSTATDYGLKRGTVSSANSPSKPPSKT